MSDTLGPLLHKSSFTRENLVRLLGLSSPRDTARLRARANEVLNAHLGPAVYYRGIIELSNVCALDCHYCGIRAGNAELERYTLSDEDILEAAQWCAQEGYGSVVLQAGERQDAAFVDWIEQLIGRIHRETILPELPEGLGITLSLGEQSLDTYRRWYAAGAHRYLLRIETTNPGLFARIHPADQTLASRLQALQDLDTAGYLVGTGVMIGIPGQTLEMLAEDILFFRDRPIDMIGMGPWLPHEASPMKDWEGAPEPEARLQLAFNMIAAVRLACPQVNIAASTALQAMVPDGRERGLTYGANVTMPNLTPVGVRGDYRLYEGKPCTDEAKEACRGCLLDRVRSIGREVAFNQWGDAPGRPTRSDVATS
nr:[FeFe] hydrogenase H-cluster radical SAM maturase HydE [uncultured Holophaga sp.]